MIILVVKYHQPYHLADFTCKALNLMDARNQLALANDDFNVPQRNIKILTINGKPISYNVVF